MNSVNLYRENELWVIEDNISKIIIHGSTVEEALSKYRNILLALGREDI